MKRFEETPVHERVKTFFNSVLEHNRLAHAYLFYGAPGTGKCGFALELARTLNCTSDTVRPCGKCAACQKTARLNHPDVKYLYPAPKSVYEDSKKFMEILKFRAAHPYHALPVNGALNIPINAIRGLKDEAKYAPFEGGYRIFILESVEYMQTAAANSFLKLLEEPPEKLVLILITQDIHDILDTIRSRCQPVFFPRLNDQHVRAILKRENVEEEVSASMIAANDYNIREILARLKHAPADFSAQATRFLRGAVSGNWALIHPVIDHVLEKKDKKEVFHFLETLEHWLADAFHQTTLQEKAALFLESEKEASGKFARAYNRLDFDAAVQNISRCRGMLEQSARPEMTLSRLAIDLQTLIRAL